MESPSLWLGLDCWDAIDVMLFCLRLALRLKVLKVLNGSIDGQGIDLFAICQLRVWSVDMRFKEEMTLFTLG